jgi:hypothetical protein
VQDFDIVEEDGARILPSIPCRGYNGRYWLISRFTDVIERRSGWDFELSIWNLLQRVKKCICRYVTDSSAKGYKYVIWLGFSFFVPIVIPYLGKQRIREKSQLSI